MGRQADTFQFGDDDPATPTQASLRNVEFFLKKTLKEL